MEEKVRRLLLYAVGFFGGRAFFLGTNPFAVALLTGAYYIKLSTPGYVLSIMAGMASLFFVPEAVVTNGQYLFLPDAGEKTVLFISYVLIMAGVSWVLHLKSANNLMILFIYYIVGMAYNIYAGGDYRQWIMLLLSGIIAVTLIPVVKIGLNVLVNEKGREDNLNEQMLAVMVIMAVMAWGMPYTIAGLIHIGEIFGMYIALCTLQKYGGAYGLGIAFAISAIWSVRTEETTYIAAVITMIIMALLGRSVFGGIKYGTVGLYVLGGMLTGVTFFGYLLTFSGIQVLLVPALLFAVTPAYWMCYYGENIRAEHDRCAAVEINRLTARKIADLSGIFKRIEYTLAGCGGDVSRIGLSEVGELIEKFSEDIERLEPASNSREEKLRQELLAMNVVLEQLTMAMNEADHSRYYLTLRAHTRKRVRTRQVAAVLEHIMDRRIRPAADAPEYIPVDDHMIVFEDIAVFQCAFQVRRVKKQGSVISGDSFSVRENDDGKLVLMLADGMGSGSIAASESEILINTMEEMLDAGFDPLYAIAFANKCLSEKNRGSNFTTFDMGMIDLYSGELKMYKQGASATFVVRDGSCHIVQGTTLPIGVLPEVECDSSSEQLSDGDIVIMASDGIFSHTEDYDEKEFARFLSHRSYNTDNRESAVKKIMDDISGELLSRNQGVFYDDATVMVVVANS